MLTSLPLSPLRIWGMLIKWQKCFHTPHKYFFCLSQVKDLVFICYITVQVGDEEPGVEEGSRSILTASGSLPFSSPAFSKKPSNWEKSPMETFRDWASLNSRVRMEQWRCCGHLLNYTSVFIGILCFLFPFWWKNFAVTLSLKKTGKKNTCDISQHIGHSVNFWQFYHVSDTETCSTPPGW